MQDKTATVGKPDRLRNLRAVLIVFTAPFLMPFFAGLLLDTINPYGLGLFSFTLYSAIIGACFAYLLFFVPDLKYEREYARSLGWIAVLLVIAVVWAISWNMEYESIALLYCAALAVMLQWKKALVLLVACPYWYFTVPVVYGTVNDYWNSTATYYTSSRNGHVFADSYSTNLNCSITLYEDLPENQRVWSTYINNEVLKYLVEAYGPVKGLPYSEYPIGQGMGYSSVGDSVTRVNFSELADPQFTFDGKPVRFTPEVVDRLREVYRVPQEGKDEYVTIGWYNDTLLWFVFPSNSLEFYYDTKFKQLAVPTYME